MPSAFPKSDETCTKYKYSSRTTRSWKTPTDSPSLSVDSKSEREGVMGHGHVTVKRSCHGTRGRSAFLERPCRDNPSSGAPRGQSHQLNLQLAFEKGGQQASGARLVIKQYNCLDWTTHRSTEAKASLVCLLQSTHNKSSRALQSLRGID